MRLIMRRDRSSRCVMSARDAVNHHSSQRKRRKHLFSNRVNNNVLTSGDVVRNNVKRVALSRNSNDRNPSSSLADSRSRPSVGPVRLRLKDLPAR